jgi:hypothetical protein
MFKESYLEYRYDLDFAWLDELTTDERYEAHSLAELEQLLARWIPDFAVLRIPADVRYPELPPKPGPGWWIWAHATQKSEGES